MVSFDVKYIFTSVLLEYTIDIIIKRIFEDHEIAIIFTKCAMKKLLTLCTKNVQPGLYPNWVAMVSPLEPLIANIFMIDLETTLSLKLEDHVQKWTPFIDNTFAYFKVG